MDKYVSYIDPRQNMRGFVVGILILAGLGMAVGAAIVTNQPPRVVNVEEISTERFSSPNVFVYSYWAGDRSEVKSFDLSNGNEAILATLPLSVKHVKLLSSNEIIYINETDDNDHGSQIVVKTIPDGSDTIAVTASADVKIDDYRVSPNGQYIATWEVALPPDSGQLFNGLSRVYVTDINSGVKNQIVSEQANVPVHYPVAVTNDGRVFMDKFLPNDSAGWSYGMSVSDFSGTNVQEIASMTNGSYGSQPVLSSDGSMLVLTGYDGSKGSGADVINNGTRRAILSANTVDILDVNTLSRRRLSNLSASNFYSKAWWDDISGNVIVSLISKNPEETGSYTYNLSTDSVTRIDLTSLDSISSNPKRPISILSPGIILAGNVTTSESTLGNLGGHYDQVLDGTYIVNENENDIISLDIANGFIQPLAVKPSGYFAGSAIFSTTSSDGTSGGIKGREKEQLQLQTFTIKPTLAPARNEQQSGNNCRDIVAASCNELLGTNYTPEDARAARSGQFHDEAFGTCALEQWQVAATAGCANSPLYLYGDKGKEVNVKVGTSVSNSNAPYTPLNGYSGVLLGDGGVEIEGVNYSSLDFDYELGAKYIRPTRGIVIERDELDKKLTEYAESLGMNRIETKDFISRIKSETFSSKIFVSHFSNEISKKLLPLYFSPEPESYTNLVFYVNDSGFVLDKNPAAPSTEKIARRGFTAVEISYIVQR